MRLGVIARINTSADKQGNEMLHVIVQRRRSAATIH